MEPPDTEPPATEPPATEPYAGTHSWEIFEHVSNDTLGRMPASVVARMVRGLEAGGEPVPPRPSATVVPLRRDGDGWAVWMMRRRQELKFGGVWAFPGGALEPADEAYADPLRACAARELAEETGCVAEPDDLVVWARWITPAGMPFRFDTWFYLWPVPDGMEPVAGDIEASEGRWFDGDDQIGEASGLPDEEVTLLPPTRSVLCELSMLKTVDRILAAAAGRVVEPVEPRHVRVGDGWRSSYPLRSGEWQ